MSDTVIDFHVHPKRGGKIVIDEIVNELDQWGVSRAVLLGRDSDPGDLDRPEIRNRIIIGLLTSPFSPPEYRRDPSQIDRLMAELKKRLARGTTNQEVAACVKDYPGRLVGLGSINLAKDEEYVRGKLREIDALGLRGIKLHPQNQFFNPSESETLRIVCEHFEEVGKMVMFHTGCMPGIWEIPELSQYANPKYLEAIAEDYEIPIVLAHFGSYSTLRPGIWFDEAIDLGRRHENVWFDVSAVPYVLTEEWMVREIRASNLIDRVLYGSDYIDYMGFTIDTIRSTGFLSEDEKAKILGLNAQVLLHRVGS